MARLPDTLDRGRHVELDGRAAELHFRRVMIVLLVGLVALALANVFGQRAATAATDGLGARLEVRAPAALRGGLIYEARFTVEATTDLEDARLVLDPGWFDAVTLNSTEPDAVEWGQENGRSVVGLGPLDAGETYVLRFQLQVNPTAIGRRRQDVRLEDGELLLAAVDRSVVVYP